MLQVLKNTVRSDGGGSTLDIRSLAQNLILNPQITD